MTNPHHYSRIYIKQIWGNIVRAFSTLSREEKEKIYSLARAGVPDSVLCEKYDVDEDFLLRVYEDVFASLQERRGYKGVFCKNDFFRGVE